MPELFPAPDEFGGFCPIEPVPKGRPRFNSRTRRTYTPAATQRYESAVRSFLEKEYGRRMPMDGPLYARYEFVMPRPKSVRKGKRLDDRKPDIDNLVKAFQDAMDFKRKSGNLELGVIANDSRIACVQAVKRYANGDEETGTYFSVRVTGMSVVIVGEDAPSSVLDALDPCFERVGAEGLADRKADASARTAYVVSGDGQADSGLIADVRKAFPSLERIVLL